MVYFKVRVDVEHIVEDSVHAYLIDGREWE
jgi:hypothetical protein